MVQGRAWEQGGQKRERRVVVSGEATLYIYVVQYTVESGRLSLSRVSCDVERAT
jgi:hypothetical protein